MQNLPTLISYMLMKALCYFRLIAYAIEFFIISPMYIIFSYIGIIYHRFIIRIVQNVRGRLNTGII